jgi:hypothetical protein
MLEISLRAITTDFTDFTTDFTTLTDAPANKKRVCVQT